MNNNLASQLALFESYATLAETVNKKISSQPVGWHIEHCLIVMKEVINEVLASDPKDYNWSVNLGRVFVLGTGYIPRGRAKAPDFTMPQQEITTETILQHIQEMNFLLDQFLTNTEPNKRFQHPFFGKLNHKQSLRNMTVHNHHHLKIIQDILGN